MVVSQWAQYLQVVTISLRQRKANNGLVSVLFAAPSNASFASPEEYRIKAQARRTEPQQSHENGHLDILPKLIQLSVGCR